MTSSAASFIFLVWCASIFQTSDASSAPAAGAAFVGRARTAAFFCSPTNSSANRPSQRRGKFRMFEGGDDNSAASDNTKDMGTWNPFSLAVLKLGFTEPAWTSPLNYKKADGTYLCANCRAPLFSSVAKYDSGSGWPSFWKTIESNRVALEREWDGRIECKCANCGGHLGHVFPDGPTRGSLESKEVETVPKSDPQIGYKVQGEGGEGSKYSRMPRFCVNGVALRFEEDQ